MPRVDTQWFADCGWGVFCHYLCPNAQPGDEDFVTPEAWNARVDAFDVEGLVAQLVDVNAPYFFLTIGQNSGHFCSPNETYDKLTGITPSCCSKRDLIGDVADALAPHGIRMMAYLPSGAPAACPPAIESLGWEWGFEGDWPGSWGTPRKNKRLADFQRKWEAIIRDWSLRFGDRVHGWWIDGCYFADEMYRHDDDPNFASFAAALRAGNPDAIVAFNPGVKAPVICHTPEEDFTAGEIAELFPTVPGPLIDGARTHILTYMGDTWGGKSPRFPDAFAVGYTQYVADKGGVTTWDVGISQEGLISQACVDQLKAIGHALRS